MLHLHRAERADVLAGVLAGILAEPAGDAFAAEVVAVPARGVERWLTQRLSHALGAQPGLADGVCANVEFPHPADLVADAVAAAAGIAADDDPWQPDRLRWPLLDTVDACVGESWCPELTAHLGPGGPGADHRRDRRMATAGHLARLLDSYGAHRPQMIRDWAAGRDTDGGGTALAEDLRWQAELWRRVRDRVGQPSPAERLPAACALLRDQPECVPLPARVALLGPTRLTTAQLEVLAALADRRAVHLFLPHPSAVLWARVAPVAAGPGSRRRSADPTSGLARHPLLASLGRDARELQVRLSRLQVPAGDRHHPAPPRPPTALGRLQQALADDTPGAPAAADAGDRSLQVHACHGSARQVEVLREVLVGLLADDPSLEPRDVLVMCPDIEDYAPLISATFGLVDDDDPDPHPGHRLRVRLADRSLRQTNPLLDTVAALLELGRGRVTLTDVLDLAGSPAVRRRFGFTDDELDRLRRWAVQAGVRWGFDAAGRTAFGLGELEQNTWRAGLDRLLLGAAMSEDELRWVGRVLPLDDVDSSDIDLAGRLAELVDRLAALVRRMTGWHPLEAWLALLADALDLLTDTQDSDAWQGLQARRELTRLADDAGPRSSAVPLSLADVHALLADRLRGRPTRANFRTGNLTMCSMVPMRSVPHRVVCLLGMDDGAFPRTVAPDGDDVLARDPWLGERDARSEDRQLLLDAVLAARDHLVVLYTGADPRTNAVRPPAVPIGEILDAAELMGVPRARLVVRHPLQPFDGRNFRPGELGRPGPFSFDRHAARGADRAAGPRVPPAAFLGAELPPAGTPEVSLPDLVGFVEHPVRAFLRQRLALTLLADESEPAEALAVELSPLEEWAVGDRLLRQRLAGATADAARGAEWRRQTLPPRHLGGLVLSTVMPRVDRLLADAEAHRAGEPATVDVVLDLAGRRLTGSVGPIHGEAILRVEYSRLAAKHRLRAWVQLLAVTARHPGRPWTAVTIGRGAGERTAQSVLGPVDAETARAVLAGLVELREAGLRGPLPMAVRSSARYAQARRRGSSEDNARASAGQEWVNDRYGGERDDAAHVLVFGPEAPFEVLTAEPAEETGESTRFGEIARAVWEPVLAAEVLT